jgi:tetratricopeptide (TPR) repeat protein
MKRLFLLGVAVALLPACSTTQDVAIRPTATALAAGAQSAEFRVAEANGHLRLGNVALALEGFRRASREDPANTAALVGMARCYDQMGRGDLSRQNFEKALALQPRDEAIMAALEASLVKAGATGEAARLRREQAAQSAAKSPLALSLAQSVHAMDQAGASMLTAGGVAFWAPLVALAERIIPARTGPRLERTGVGEMKLVTSKTPQWKPLPALAAAQRTPRAANLPPSSAAPPVRITILNAGSLGGAAARTRTHLQQLGWSSIAIANAARALDRTELRYPASLATEGKRLARQLKVPVQARPTETLDRIVLRLGRDVSSAKPI